MSFDLLMIGGSAAQLGCFAMIARASYRFFRQGESQAHTVTRLANVGATVAFAALALAGPVTPPALVALAIALTALSVWLFHRATVSANAGVLHVAFAEGASAELVTGGIYRHIRNPFYTSYLVYWTAWAVLLDFAWPGMMGLAFFAGLYWLAVLREEKALEGQFGAPYTAYKARAGRFVPRVFGRA